MPHRHRRRILIMSDTALAAEVGRHAEQLDDHSGSIAEIRTELHDHVTRSQERHEAVMAALADVRGRLDRSLASYVWDLGSDPVTVPLLGSTRVRTIGTLAAILVGTLVALGISGDDVWSLVASRVAGESP
jgi:hypothetical protein